MRRTPMAINTAFYPNLMWNSRFAALSGDPFDNRAGFAFPRPRGCRSPTCRTCWRPRPSSRRPSATRWPASHFPGDNDAIRAEVLRRLNGSAAYREALRRGLPGGAAPARPITFDMFGQAIAEFEFTLTFADAPIDRFARGQRDALTDDQKRGALLFFGEGRLRATATAWPARRTRCSATSRTTSSACRRSRRP